MKKPIQEIENKDSIANDLNKVSTLLLRHNLCDDVTPLTLAYNQCAKHSDQEKWGYSMESLSFKIDKLSHTIPHSLATISASLSIEIEGFYCSETIKNPLKSLKKFDIEVKGINSEQATFLSCWHLDKHSDFPTSDQQKSKLVHPEYHFSHGGRVMEDSGYDFGSALIQRSPRIFHPPMDAILGIDFILKNYVYISATENLFAESEYHVAVQNSKLRLWMPYFIALASNWYSFPSELIADNTFPKKIFEC